MSYRDLKSYQQATVIYDFTLEFCNRYMTYKSNKSYRTYDQMVQAARSGKQNIVEGSSQRASKKSEIKLLAVARASFQELLEDYEDFLRQRKLKQWRKDEPRALEVRNLYRTNTTNRSDKSYWSYLDSSEDAANAAICLINQVNFLLDRQIYVLEEKFLQEGGYSENLKRKRADNLKRKINWSNW